MWGAKLAFGPRPGPLEVPASLTLKVQKSEASGCRGSDLPMWQPRRRFAGLPNATNDCALLRQGDLATIGRRAAVADFHELKLKVTIGWPGWSSTSTT